MKRRDFCKNVAGVTGVALGTDALVSSVLSPAFAQVSGPQSEQIGEIYQLQAAFHRAKTTRDIDLMMSLWDPDGILNNQGDPNSPYVGFEQLKTFWLNSGSFTHRRFSLVPSYKIRMNVFGNQASLYFECHDVADYDQPTRHIINDTFLAGTLRNVSGTWVFYDMSAGPATPLSLDQYYA